MPKPSKTGVQGLYRDKDGRYRLDLRWMDPNTGQRRRFRQRLAKGVSAAAAKQRAKEVLSSALAGTFDPKRERPRKLHAALDEYVVWSETNRPRTARDRTGLVRTLKAYFSDRLLDELAPFHVEGFKAKRRKDDAAPGTINRAVAMLKHFYGRAAEWGWVSERHALSIRGVKMLKEPPGRVRWLSDDERAALFAALPASIKPIVETTLLTGMRLGEVVELRKSAVDLARRQLSLRETKSNKVRHIPVNDALAPILKASMAANDTAFVFVGMKGKPYTRHGFGAMFRRAVKKAGIEDLRFHDLRHDFATRVRRAGAGLDTIAKLLGHSSLEMANRYAHLGDAELVRAVGGLGLGAQSSDGPKRIEGQGERSVFLQVSEKTVP